jgi:hypothetical protein
MFGSTAAKLAEYTGLESDLYDRLNESRILQQLKYSGCKEQLLQFNFTSNIKEKIRGGDFYYYVNEFRNFILRMMTSEEQRCIGFIEINSYNEKNLTGVFKFYTKRDFEFKDLCGFAIQQIDSWNNKSEIGYPIIPKSIDVSCNGLENNKYYIEGWYTSYKTTDLNKLNNDILVIADIFDSIKYNSIVISNQKDLVTFHIEFTGKCFIRESFAYIFWASIFLKRPNERTKPEMIIDMQGKNYDQFNSCPNHYGSPVFQSIDSMINEYTYCDNYAVKYGDSTKNSIIITFKARNYCDDDLCQKRDLFQEKLKEIINIDETSILCNFQPSFSRHTILTIYFTPKIDVSFNSINYLFFKYFFNNEDVGYYDITMTIELKGVPCYAKGIAIPDQKFINIFNSVFSDQKIDDKLLEKPQEIIKEEKKSIEKLKFNKTTYKIIKYLDSIDGITINGYIVKRTRSNKDSKRFTLNQHDCELLNIEYQKNLEIIPNV